MASRLVSPRVEGFSVDDFFKEYGAALDSGTAALFAGAGLSQPSGYVNWRELLRGFAEELGLDVDVEQDLVAVAQYHINANNKKRDRLNQQLVNQFVNTARRTPSHEVLARLPIRTFWTTNYDALIEQALSDVGKKPDVKLANARLTTTRPGWDAAVYKMHGDPSDPNQIVITRDDYEAYERDHTLLLQALQSDLVNKTFLFLGFSFTDPNLEHVLGQLRAVVGDSSRSHYAVMRRTNRQDYSRLEHYRYEANKQQLRLQDLRNYGVHTVIVDRYAEIQDILAELERRYHRRSVMVSSAAHDFAPFGRTRLEEFCQTLGARLIRDDYNLVSGFGLGTGSAVIAGSLEALYEQYPIPGIEQRLRLRPFPQGSVPRGMTGAEFYRRYRLDMIQN
jgi:hypothetical protein